MMENFSRSMLLFAYKPTLTTF